jgi:hypothetical protein
MVNLHLPNRVCAWIKFLPDMEVDIPGSRGVRSIGMSISGDRNIFLSVLQPESHPLGIGSHFRSAAPRLWAVNASDEFDIHCCIAAPASGQPVFYAVIIASCSNQRMDYWIPGIRVCSVVCKLMALNECPQRMRNGSFAQNRIATQKR